MSVGLQVFNAAGALIWDSSTVVGGVVADVRDYPSGASDTVLYPAFAGRTAFLMNPIDTAARTITLDTALGYPRVTVPVADFARRFVLLVM